MQMVQTLAEDEKAKMRRAIETQRNFQRQSQSVVWRNPVQSKSAEELRGEFKGEGDAVLCAFFMKTGACRYGEACSKPHPYPSISATIVIKHMYDGPGMADMDEDNDDDLETEEHEIYKSFCTFFEDVVPEFQAFGTVLTLRVCRNHSDHLRGHTYVSYSSEAEAKKAYDALNGRFYAGKQLMILYSPLVNWKGAICGSFAKGICERGKNCNFLHVFKNPGGILEGMVIEAKTFSGLGFSGRNERGNERNNRTDRPTSSFVKGNDTILGNADNKVRETDKETERPRDHYQRDDRRDERRRDDIDRRDDYRRDERRDERREDRRDDRRDERRDERRDYDRKDRRDERREDGRRDDRRDERRDRYNDDDKEKERRDNDRKRDEYKRNENDGEKRNFRDKEYKISDDSRKRKETDHAYQQEPNKKEFRETF